MIISFRDYATKYKFAFVEKLFEEIETGKEVCLAQMFNKVETLWW